MSKTAAERQHMDGVAQLGCIQCIFDGIEGSPAEIHHMGTGGGGRRNHMNVAGLCPHHHRWALAIDKKGKERRFLEREYKAYADAHCGCPSCKRGRE